jgi:8-amino-7-oxononanoate synthase
VGAEDQAIAMWRGVLNAGLYVNIVLPPACRPDACLLRTSYSAAHTRQQLDRALDVFEQVGRALAVIDSAA